MATMYSQVTFPQAPAGGWTFNPNAPVGVVSYAPYIPSTATLQGAITPPTWNPYSSTAADRTMWLVDTAGTLTYDQAMLDAYGLDTLRSNQISLLKEELNQIVTSGAPVTYDGTQYTIDTLAHSLTLNLTKALASHYLLLNVQPWAENYTYPANSYCSVGGVLLYTPNGGTSGTTAPTPPTEFATYVTDNTVSWSLLGFIIRLTNNQVTWMTPQAIINVFQQTVLELTNVEATYYDLTTEVSSMTSVSSILSTSMPPASSF